MKAIIKNELRKYFYSPLGYIVIGLILVVFSLYMLSGIVMDKIFDMGISLYYTLELALSIIVALASMGLFAEERKTGTEKILLSAPISTFKMILSKFLSVGIIVLIAGILMTVEFFIFKAFGPYSIVEGMAQILGFMLVLMAGVSFGMFVSSVSENSIIAGALTIIPMIIFNIVSTQLMVENALMSIIYLPRLYINFARGIISIADILVLLLFIAFFFILTMLVFKRRKLVK